MPYLKDDKIVAKGIKSLAKDLGNGIEPDYNSEYDSLSDLRESTIKSLEETTRNVLEELTSETPHSALPNMISEVSHHVDILDAVVAAKAAMKKQK